MLRKNTFFIIAIVLLCGILFKCANNSYDLPTLEFKVALSQSATWASDCNELMIAAGSLKSDTEFDTSFSPGPRQYILTSGSFYEVTRDQPVSILGKLAAETYTLGLRCGDRVKLIEITFEKLPGKVNLVLHHDATGNLVVAKSDPKILRTIDKGTRHAGLHPVF